MKKGKVLFSVVLLLSICSCSKTRYLKNEKANHTIVAQLITGRDSYSFSKSIYELEKEAYPGREPYHTREIEMNFIIKNNSSFRYFFPYESLEYDSCHSYLKVWFQQDSLRVVPHYSLKRAPNDSLYLNPGDSITLIVRINRFPDWQVEGCDVNTHYSKLISMLQVDYTPFYMKNINAKSNCRIPQLKFIIDPQNIALYEGGKPSEWRYDMTIEDILSMTMR